jgi:hypothetical protein
VTFFCCDRRRLDVIKLQGSANGIEFLEVRDHLEPDPSLRQRTLFVRLLRPGFAITADNVRIDGGERLPVVPVEWAAAADALPAGTDPSLVDGIEDLPRTLVVRTTTFGDFSRYTLRLLAGSGSDLPPAGFDPRLATIKFSFKVECPSDFDCAEAGTCPPTQADAPDIDYLAKDYTGFRRLMLDRLNLLVPSWRERSAADLGVAIVEVLAYAADHLSYRQDAIANEAYLGTARRRVSVRRHARLVDYALHDGCNARAWVHVEVTADTVLPRGTTLLSRVDGLGTEIQPGSRALDEAIAGGVTVFETAHDADLAVDSNTLSIYAWGDRGCCLARGGTRATLHGAHPGLRAGAVIVLQEVVSPTTFEAKDADRDKRWAVRLTSVAPGVDPSGQLFDEPAVDGPIDITEITWDAADALPFPLCVSVAERPGLEISVAKGNIVLADHGRTIDDEHIGSVPPPTRRRVPAIGASPCERTTGDIVHARFRPTLRQAPITQGFDLAADLRIPVSDSEEWPSALALITRDPHDALPRMTLSGQLDLVVDVWTPRRDLLSSAASATDFVLETDSDGTAHVRFGDDVHGQRPDVGTSFAATYRVGNGVAGNVGAEAIFHVVTTAAGRFARVANLLPAAGGVDPEDLEAARRDAPRAFRTQERAVTAADYAAAAERRDDVQRAAATFRWTGSWHTVFVTADRQSGAPVDARFETRLRRHLERFRMAGYDLEVDGPRHVALDVALHICVKAQYFRSEVLKAVRAVLGSHALPDGRLGVFHPDNFSFGDSVYLSRVVAAAQAVEGVEAVWPKKFQRMVDPDVASLDTGEIRIGRLEIAQLANNPNFREQGRLTIEAGGGK